MAEPLVVNKLGFDAPNEIGGCSRRSTRRGFDRPTEYAHRYPHELSGGQRQRVVIAGALVMGPELIVADEPVSMLDVSIRTELLRLMLDLRAERGLTYLFITHDLSLAWVIADRIAVMYLGKIMEIGPAEAVIRSPRNPYTQALVSVSPSPDPPTAGERAQRTILEGETPDAAHIPTGCRFNPRCPTVFDRCRVEEPPLFDVGGGQAAACWLAEPAGDCADGGRALPMADAVRSEAPAGRGAGHVTDPFAADADAARRARPADDRGPAERQARRPSSAELAGLGAAAGWRPAPGEWSANECVGHLIEAERRGFAGRIRRIVDAAKGDQPHLPPDLEAWDPPAVAAARRDDLRDGRGAGRRVRGPARRRRRPGPDADRGRPRARPACIPRSARSASTSCSANGSTTTAITSASCWR